MKDLDDNARRMAGEILDPFEGEPMPPPGAAPPKRTGPWAHLPLEPHPDLADREGGAPGGARQAFPMGALPGPVAELASAVATFAQTPPDLPGCLALGVLSAAVAGKVRVRVRGHYEEATNLFVVSLLGPGNRKSPVFRQMFGPVKKYERFLVKQTKAARAVVQAERRTLEDEGKALRARLRGASAADRVDLDREIAANAEKLEALPSSADPCLYLQDVTPEVIAKVLDEQRGRICIADAEGAFFDGLSRYSDEPNFNNVLKGQAGDEIRVRRMNGTELRIDRPVITLVMTAQPNVLFALAQKPGALDRGLIGRILVSRPASLIGFRDMDPPEVPQHLWARYAAPVRTLLELSPPKGEGGRERVLELSGEARAERLEFVRAIENMMRPAGPLAHMHDWGSKIQGAVAGIAGILHFAEAACAGDDLAMRNVWHAPVSGVTMACAVELAWYFFDHARAVYDELLVSPEQRAERDRQADSLAAVDWIGEHCCGGRGATTGEVISNLFPDTKAPPPPAAARARAAIAALAGAKGGEVPNPLKLGKALSALVGRVIGGKRLETAGKLHGAVRWKVVRVGPWGEVPVEPPAHTYQSQAAEKGYQGTEGEVDEVGEVAGGEKPSGAEGKSAA